MKHVGKMKNNSARIVAVYKTLPGDHTNCLIVGTQGLGDSYHDALMNLIEGDTGQQANELADVLAVRKFPDGSNMLQYLHTHGHLKKVPTTMVLMTPNPQTQIPLDELNELIAKQKGISIEELAISDGSAPMKKKTATEQNPVIIETPVEVKQVKLSPSELRSKADALYKEAARLKKEADTLDPPKKKLKADKVEAE